MEHLFICWSGDRSQRLGEALEEYLPLFVPQIRSAGTRLFMSRDIPKGIRWFDAVEEELDRADAGLVCITREALQSGWIHFEAGALARAVRKNERLRRGALYTYLLGVQPDELTGPLAAFQSTRFDREDTQRLCASIAASIGTADATGAEWEKAFDDSWPAFERKVEEIPALAASKLIPELESLFRRKTFNEPLDECTRQSWIDRFTAVRETIAGLESHRDAMQADGSYLLDLYNDLLEQLDGYSMNMGALLLHEKKFEIDARDGKLVVGEGVKRACEGRRGRIRQIVTHLLAPNCAPVLEAESRRYAKIASFDARKTILIHPMERAIQQEREGRRQPRLERDELERCAASLWEFDRIYYYLVQEGSPEASLPRLVDAVEQELERVRSVEGASSLVPLHYALRAFERRYRNARQDPGVIELAMRIRPLVTRIASFVGEFELDKGRQLRDNLDELQSLLDETAVHS
jgi:TIR domain